MRKIRVLTLTIEIGLSQSVALQYVTLHELVVCFGKSQLLLPRADIILILCYYTVLL